MEKIAHRKVLENYINVTGMDLTTDEIKKLPEWPAILECLNEAAKMAKKEYPGLKVELVTKKYKFLIVVDGDPVTEITGENLGLKSDQT